MGDISDAMPKISPTLQAVYDWHKKRGDSQTRRQYLGASILGHECDRYLWYSFRWCFVPNFSGRMYRLFETGHLEEPRMTEELRGAGLEVHDVDDAGEQYGFVDLGGHSRGHCDGFVLGVIEAPKTWHLLEDKTHKASSFRKLVSEGVKLSKPQHWAQCMIYMGYFKLTRCFYYAKNKDTDELHVERIRFDADEFKKYVARAERIVRAPLPPERCSDRKDWYVCKMCDAFDVCWGSIAKALPIPDKSCRTCCHSTPEVDEGESWARWSCALHRKDLSFEVQQKACMSHLVLPPLITFAEPTDSGATWIEFTNKSDGAVWQHGEGKGEWKTEELMVTPGPIVGKSVTGAVKKALEAEVVKVETPIDEGDLTLVERYDPGDCELLFEGNSDTNSDQILEKLKELLMVPGGEKLPEPTCEFDDDAYYAAEFDNRFCFVIYKADTYAAIWGGKE